MSPLPEEKVEALAEALGEHRTIVTGDEDSRMIAMCACGWRGHPGDGIGHQAQALAPLVAGWLAVEREQIAAAIEALRNEHWQRHLAEHPYATANSCPADYAAHDAYYAAARIARGDS